MNDQTGSQCSIGKGPPSRQHGSQCVAMYFVMFSMIDGWATCPIRKWCQPNCGQPRTSRSHSSVDGH
ncbi:hypothetical protein D9M69_612450 [compost metagenome]